MPRERKVRIVVEALDQDESSTALPALLAAHGYRARFHAQYRAADRSALRLDYDIGWVQTDKDDLPPELLGIIATRYLIVSFEMTSESHA